MSNNTNTTTPNGSYINVRASLKQKFLCCLTVNELTNENRDMNNVKINQHENDEKEVEDTLENDKNEIINTVKKHVVKQINQNKKILSENDDTTEEVIES